MFDAKSLLEMMVAGSKPRQGTAAAAPADAGGLGDLLGQLARMVPGAQATPGQPGQATPGQGPAGLDDLLRQLTGAAGGGASSGAAGGLGDILGRIQQQAGQAMGQRGAAGAAPSIMDILGQVLGQATSGMREGAGKIGAATGAGEAIGKMTGGQSLDDILAKVKEFAAQNQFGAGAAAGGLGAVILGTETGRNIAATAARIGALALIGGLAYKAYTNYQAGKPLITGAETLAEAAPDGSGFEPDALTNQSAILMIKAMIAAAAADGRVDPVEMEGIVGNLKQAGFDAEAEEFIAGELNAPATADDLAGSCVTPEQCVQVYTAARLAITLDSPAEKQFLATLAEKLQLTPELIAHIEAATRGHA